MRKSETLARRWMPGTRFGSKRPAWAHPEDLVKLLHELRAAFPSETDEDYEFRSLEDEGFEAMVDIAWMHDLIEDGVRLDAQDNEHTVTPECIQEQGFPAYIVQQVKILTKWDDEDKAAYLTRVGKEAPVKTLIVKLVDRICNLREGKDSFPDSRWARYVMETETYILPMLDKIQEPERGWLKNHLITALRARPVFLLT